jgi:hypothetical protein
MIADENTTLALIWQEYYVEANANGLTDAESREYADLMTKDMPNTIPDSKVLNPEDLKD